ncbi:hypothetical protein [Herbaspirillum autotrophicum]|uniref:hypothetical protein n=1 Tax=Herbaspirillum autotrophicum TaxID=180195 RepID=UPI00067BDA22|nr:hypothetical protein [Herbaspirillum autotrophicum]
MDESIEMQKIKMQLTAQSAALHAICAALEPAMSDTAQGIFRAATEDAHAGLQQTGVDKQVLDFFATLCASLEDALQHRP